LRRALAALGATALLLLVSASPAAPEGRIVIHGAAAGTHLRLGVSDGELTVTGPMAEATEGCELAPGKGAATCPLADVGQVEIETGPSEDKVEVLDQLPVPLIAYLGAGSDKLIGNDEPDSCHPQGTPRNRCIGNGGNDICVSAPVNTDCVGGPGEDLCKTSDGSDGCWGGPGSDICSMGAGQDGCHGEAGNDRLFGGPGGDQLYGGEGYDLCNGEAGLGQMHRCEIKPPGPGIPRCDCAQLDRQLDFSARRSLAEASRPGSHPTPDASSKIG
jgi:Ca2+-binding RTX toxin-like protein